MKKRYNNLALYRIIAALAIIYFHIAFIAFDRDIPYEFLLSKCVQGLTALSGFLYARRKIENGWKFLLGAARKLLIPALVCVTFMALWNLVYFLVAGAGVNYFSLFLDTREYGGSLLIQPGNFYYIIYILICYAITPFLKKRKLHTPIIIIAVLTELLISFIFGVAIIVTPYLVGYVIGEHFFESYTDTKYKPLPILAWLGIFAAAFASYVLVVSFPFGNTWLLDHLYGILRNATSSAVGTVFFFLFIYIVKCLNRFNEPKFLLYTDRLSLVIFLMNQAFLCGGMDVTAFFTSLLLDVLMVYVFTLGSAALIDLIIILITRLIKKRKAAVA